MYHIGLDDLVSNGFIEGRKLKQNMRFLTFSQLEKYGMYVLLLLQEKGKQARLELSRDRTAEFLDRYVDFFEEGKNKNGLPGITLKKGVSSKDLIQEFRGVLALDVLKAFINAGCAEVLLFQ